MTATLHRECSEIWKDVDADKSVSSVIITGSDKAFSAGGDLAHERRVCDDYELRMQAMKESRNLVFNMIDCSKPIVSAVRGWAVGAGIACALLADISIAAKDAKFSDGHAKIGIASGDHATILWPLLCGMARAKYYLLLSEPFSGAQAAEMGLVSLAVEDAELDAKALEIAIAPGRTRARGSALDQADAQSLAAAGGADLRCLARARIHRHGGARGPRGHRRLPAEARAQLLARHTGLIRGRRRACAVVTALQTMADLVDRNARLHAADLHLIFGAHRSSFATFARRARQLASALYAIGLRHQDRVSILAMNCPEYLDVYGACEVAPFIVNPVNYRLAPPEMAWIVRDAAPKVLIIEQQYAPIIDGLREEMPSVEHYIVIGGDVPPWASGFEAVLDVRLGRRRAAAAAAGRCARDHVHQRHDRAARRAR